ncbi:MAG TPA: hypothetical protein VGN90_01445 [Pyrinomonadaceae bacterium]|jgi:hypothetical protein|nr:hypothetical protein [Pyrinomonadaceae bacterium]
MTTVVGVMGSASDAAPGERDQAALTAKAAALAQAIAERKLVLLTGTTTGLVYVVGKTAHDSGGLHVGISPANNRAEHVDKYKLPHDACDLIVYTGFGLKGRNVVLVRSCEIVLFIAGSMGSLNEFTIAHDEGKVIGCLTGTGGVADEVDYLLQKFSKDTGARVFQNDDPAKLIDDCLQALPNRKL